MPYIPLSRLVIDSILLNEYASTSLAANFPINSDSIFQRFQAVDLLAFLWATGQQQITSTALMIDQVIPKDELVVYTLERLISIGAGDVILTQPGLKERFLLAVFYDINNCPNECFDEIPNEWFQPFINAPINILTQQAITFAPLPPKKKINLNINEPFDFDYILTLFHRFLSVIPLLPSFKEWQDDDLFKLDEIEFLQQYDFRGIANASFTFIERYSHELNLPPEIIDPTNVDDVYMNSIYKLMQTYRRWWHLIVPPVFSFQASNNRLHNLLVGEKKIPQNFVLLLEKDEQPNKKYQTQASVVGNLTRVFSNIFSSVFTPSQASNSPSRIPRPIVQNDKTSKSKEAPDIFKEEAPDNLDNTIDPDLEEGEDIFNQQALDSQLPSPKRKVSLTIDIPPVPSKDPSVVSTPSPISSLGIVTAPNSPIANSTTKSPTAPPVAITPLPSTVPILTAPPVLIPPPSPTLASAKTLSLSTPTATSPVTPVPAAITPSPISAPSPVTPVPPPSVPVAIIPSPPPQPLPTVPVANAPSLPLLPTPSTAPAVTPVLPSVPAVITLLPSTKTPAFSGISQATMEKYRQFMNRPMFDQAPVQLPPPQPATPPQTVFPFGQPVFGPALGQTQPIQTPPPQQFLIPPPAPPTTSIIPVPATQTNTTSVNNAPNKNITQKSKKKPVKQNNTTTTPVQSSSSSSANKLIMPQVPTPAPVPTATSVSGLTLTLPVIKTQASNAPSISSSSKPISNKQRRQLSKKQAVNTPATPVKNGRPIFTTSVKSQNQIKSALAPPVLPAPTVQPRIRRVANYTKQDYNVLRYICSMCWLFCYIRGNNMNYVVQPPTDLVLNAIFTKLRLEPDPSVFLLSQLSMLIFLKNIKVLTT